MLETANLYCYYKSIVIEVYQPTRLGRLWVFYFMNTKAQNQIEGGDLSTSSVSMSVKEARKRLGSKYKKMSDIQIEHLVSLLSSLASQIVKDLGSTIIH